MIQTPIFLDSLVLRFAIKHKQNLGFAYDEGLLYLYEIHDIELIRGNFFIKLIWIFIILPKKYIDI